MPKSIEINKEQEKKARQIIRQETRVAADVGKMQYQNDEQKQFYSVAETKNENKFIESIFQKGGVASKLKDTDRIKLENVKERNKSHLLVNDKKFGGDSDYMETVKKTVADLEKKLAVQSIDKAALDAVEEAYHTAKVACQDYIDNKNPWFSAGKRRMRKVKDRLASIREEVEIFKIGRSALEKGVPFVKANKPMDLIEVGKKRDLDMKNDMPKFFDRFVKVTDTEFKNDNDKDYMKTAFLNNDLKDDIDVQRKKLQDDLDKDMSLENLRTIVKDSEQFFYKKNLEEIAKVKGLVTEKSAASPLDAELLEEIGKLAENLIRKKDMNEFMASAMKNQQLGTNVQYALKDRDFKGVAEWNQETLEEYKGLMNSIAKNIYIDIEWIKIPIPKQLLQAHNKRVESN